ncbi:DDE-type integrase/transposase/recombinase [Pseudoalteromonas shioyasakiensis]|uniref:DDE-type integrase/transposase/recombinase n=1 Tax=Pseudoalteromonas shioyasakiensis TaxID=1190813 RepID=UPI0021191C6A|nr:DDE-type integrase/transposase/recombinase [Pseudoalteromonas shioyasakiensis]MCQ8878788.1 DDE-type integrase/transposase/recombinase [Pseudoalteromonas shioyasakiensis]
MSALISQGAKFKMSETSYVVRSIAQEQLGNTIFYSRFDDENQTVDKADVNSISQSELVDKLVNSEALLYENTSEILTNKLLTENQLVALDMWSDFVVLHLEIHPKNFTSNNNVDETRQVFKWEEYKSKVYSRSTCQAKIKAYLDSQGDIRSLINRGYHESKNTSRLTAETDDEIYDCFCNHYFVRSDETAKSVNEIASLIRTKLSKLHKEEPALYPVIPSVDTIYRRFNAMKSQFVNEKNLSKAEVKNQRYQLGRQYVAENPLERVEMDAIYINLGVRTKSGKCPKTGEKLGTYLGTIVMMVAIDTCTRNILGYSIDVGKKVSESADLAVECLKSVITPKANPQWVASGIPVAIYTDATTATKGNAYKRFALNMGIKPIVVRAGEPQSKPFIESFFNTLRRECLKKLPGYIGSKTRINNRHLEPTETAELHSSMTRKEFIDEFERFICDFYMDSAHGGLNDRTPNAVWKSKISKQPWLQTFPHENKGLSEFRGCYRHSLTLYGNGSIKLNNEQYVSSELKELSASGVKTVECFYSKIDTRSVVVKHENDTFIVPLREMNHHEGAGFQQAELDTARKTQYGDDPKGERLHYETEGGKNNGLGNFKKAKAKEAEKKELETGRKQPTNSKVDNTKVIDVNAPSAQELILASLNSSVEYDDLSVSDDEFHAGGEL